MTAKPASWPYTVEVANNCYHTKSCARETFKFSATFCRIGLIVCLPLAMGGLRSGFFQVTN